MKRAIFGYVKVVEYGTVEVIVPENASDKEVEQAILDAEDRGCTVWGERTVTVHEWEENCHYPNPEELED